VPAVLTYAAAAAHASSHKLGTGYQVLVLLHLLCVIGGFGFLAYNGLHLSLSRRRGGALSSGALAVNRELSQFAELLVVATFVFGIAAVGSSDKVYSFSQGWVIAAIILWLVEMGLLHGFIRPRQRRYQEVSEQTAKITPGRGAPPEVAELDRLERIIGVGWGGFNVVMVVVLYLMVFKPGS
jgi:uncharacterized membrane protein